MATLIAGCEGQSEPEGTPCTGTLRFTWGMVQAACDTCGGWTGISVASWQRVEED